MKTVFTYFANVRKYAIAHKLISAVVLVVVIGGGWYLYTNATSTSGQTLYVLGTVGNSTIVSSVSESGQIASSDTVNLQPKVSGTVTWVGAQVGQTVSAGHALMSIDNTTALQQYNDDKEALAAAELQYQKDSATAPISFQNDQITLTNAQQTLADEYSNAFDVLSGVYLDEPTVSAGLNETLYGYDFSSNNTQQNVDALVSLFPNNSQHQSIVPFSTSAESDYTSARTLYDPAVLAYKGTARSSSPSTITAVLQQSIDSTTALAQSAQSTLNFLSEVNTLATGNNQKLPSTFTTLQTNARTYLTTVNSDLNQLLSEKKTINNDLQAVTTAEQNVQLDQVGNNSAGSNPISLQIEANSIEKQKEDLATESNNLANYTIVAPFNGTISAVSVKVGDNAGSAAVGSIISTNSIAQLSVNEVDAAKIKVGQKATLTFDAIPDLTMTGTVAEIDPAGTVSQGVVTYSMQISLDTQDSRIKSGMSVNATIQTAVAQNALTVPSSAIKTLNGASYVQIFNPAIATSTATASSAGVPSLTLPQNVPVTIGISDNTNTQILSGLTAGEQIVVRTTTGATSATKTPAAAATSRTGGAGGGGFGGGGAVRIGG